MRERPPGPTFAGMNKLAIVAMSFVLMSAGAVLLPPGVPDAYAAADWSWPVRGPVITAYRNGDDPYAAGQHRGIDISAPVGASVVAAAPGTVVFAGVVGSSGLTVAERTDDGRYELSYLHLSAASVRAGEHLVQGEHLGAVGTSGRRSAQEPHLHFGVREAGDRHAYRDPLEFLGPAPTRGPDPRPVPAPVPVPAPADPAPMPVPGGAGAAAAPAGGPAGAGAAAGNAAAPIRLPHPLALPGSPRGAGHAPDHAARFRGNAPRARAGLPARPPSPGHGPAPRAMVRQDVPARGHGAPDTHAPPAPLHGPDGAPSSVRPLVERVARPPAAHAVARHGIDLGWLAACLGLVAAATLLARPRRGRLTARRAFSSVRAPRDAAGVEGQ